MYPTLYHAFKDILNVEWPWMKLLNSFGFFVALAFVAASWILTLELKRKEREGILQPEKRKIVVGKPVNWTDVGINALIGFIFGWKVIYLMMNADTLFQPGSMPQQHIFNMQGNWLAGIILGVLFGIWKWWEYNKQALPQPIEKEVTYHKYQHVGNITLIAALFGVIGAKLFHLFENPDEFMLFFKEPSLENFLSGLTVFGGLIVGGVALVVYGLKKDIPPKHLIDSTAPGFILAYGIGRVGCHVSGDGDWGIVNTAPKPDWMGFLPDWLWAYNYPNNVNGVGVRISETSGWDIYEGYGTFLDPPVFPTPIYELAMTLIIFGILWWMRKRIKIPGIIFASFMIFNGVERFLIEKIRVNNVFDLLGMKVTQAEVISVLLILGGAFLIWFWSRKPLSVER